MIPLMRRRGWIGFVSAVVLFVAACTSGSSGGDDSSGDDSTDGSTTAETVSFVSQNILHGITCPAGSDRCELPSRVDLFLSQLDDAGCPDLVSMQEANQEIADLVADQLDEVCDGAYQLVYDDDPGIDRELVLTTQEVIGARRERLAGPLRSVYIVRVSTDAGIVDFVTTHLASSSDNGPCDEESCPPPCSVDDTLNTCQIREIIELVDEIADPDAIVMVGGDLNALIDEPTNLALVDAGYTDTHLAAGNPECDPDTGSECTAGRADYVLDDMTNPANLEVERIDFLWLGSSRDCEVIAPTGIFNNEPASDGPAGLAYPSDHAAVQATVSCETTQAQRDAATTATLATTTTTAPESSAPIDPEITAGITTAYENLLGGTVTDIETKLGSLEDAEALRDFFLESYEANKAIASRITLRIDNITVVDPTHADVTYSLLLEGAPVLDHLDGSAVLVDGRWLVTKATYCDVSAQGDEIPEPCQG